MKKILYTATVVRQHLMEFHIPYLKMMKEDGWRTEAAAKNDFDNPEDCIIPFCDAYYDIPFARNPFNPSNVRAYGELKKIINEGQYDIVHCHTPVGAMLTRLAARRVRKSGTKVIYTAHGFHFYKGAPLLNWLLYYPAEKFLSRYTDVLVTINREDYARASTFHAKSVAYIPGIGVDINRFSGGNINKEEMRRKLNIPKNVKILLSVGELNKNKNHGMVIEVLPHLRDCHYVICGKGPRKEEYLKRAKELGISDRVHLMGYRTDVPAFYQMADIFVFPSFREGLPVAVMEAMAAGLPVVAARNRGTNDLLAESRLRFEASDLDDLKEKLTIAVSSDCSDEIERNSSTLNRFSIDNTRQLMREIYNSCLEK